MEHELIGDRDKPWATIEFRQQHIQNAMDLVREYRRSEYSVRQLEIRVFNKAQCEEDYVALLNHYIEIMITRAKNQLQESNSSKLNSAMTATVNHMRDSRNDQEAGPSTSRAILAFTQQSPIAGPSNSRSTVISRNETTASTSRSQPSTSQPIAGTSSQTEPVPGSSHFEPIAGPSYAEPVAGPSHYQPVAGPSNAGSSHYEPIAGPSSSSEPVAGPSSRSEPVAGTSKSTYSSEIRPTGIVIRRVQSEPGQGPSIFISRDHSPEVREEGDGDSGSQDVVLNSEVITISDDMEDAVPRIPQPVQRDCRIVEKRGKLEMCNAIFVDFEMPDEEGWEKPPTCSCNPMPYDVLGKTNLPPGLVVQFMELSGNTVLQIVETLKMYGESNVSYGCKTRLLIQLKQLLIEQSALPQAFPEDLRMNEYPGPVASTSRDVPSTSHAVASPTVSPTLIMAARDTASRTDENPSFFDNPWSAPEQYCQNFRMADNMHIDPAQLPTQDYRDPRAKKRSLLRRVISSSSDTDDDSDYSVSYLKVKRNKPNNTSPRFRPPPQREPPPLDPMDHSSRGQLENSDDEDFSMWAMTNRRRSSGPLPQPDSRPQNNPVPPPQPQQPPQMVQRLPPQIPQQMPQCRVVLNRTLVPMQPIPPPFEFTPCPVLPQPAHQPFGDMGVPAPADPWQEPTLFGRPNVQQHLDDYRERFQQVNRLNPARLDINNLFDGGRLENRIKQIRDRQDLQQRRLEMERRDLQDMRDVVMNRRDVRNRMEAHDRMQERIGIGQFITSQSQDTNQNRAVVKIIQQLKTKPQKKVTVTPASCSSAARGVTVPAVQIAPPAAAASSSTAAAANIPPPPTPIRPPASENKEEAKPGSSKDKDESLNLECSICLDARREVAFVPCGHMVCCSNCADGINECPMCRQAIKAKFQVYLS